MALLVGGGGRTSTVPYEPYANGAYHENYDDAVVAELAWRSNSPPYRRETYFSERISQWQMREPDIDADDFEVIERQFERCTGKYGNLDHAFAGARWERDPATGLLRCTGYVLTKAATRRMLSQIDAERKLVGDRAFFV